jgi:hypothetical protein
MKRFLVAALALMGACGNAHEPAPAPGPVVAPAAAVEVQAEPSPAPRPEAPVAAWVAAFEHLFEISGASSEGGDPPLAYCVEVGSDALAADVIAALRAREPRHVPQTCDLSSNHPTTPDGRPAYRLWVLSMGRSVRDPDRWSVDMGFHAGPLNGAGWRCVLAESGGVWTVTDCEPTFSS